MIRKIQKFSCFDFERLKIETWKLPTKFHKKSSKKIQESPLKVPANFTQNSNLKNTFLHFKISQIKTQTFPLDSVNFEPLFVHKKITKFYFYFKFASRNPKTNEKNRKELNERNSIKPTPQTQTEEILCFFKKFSF
jgi:hypothetical protein